jgi:hypothetical protein
MELLGLGADAWAGGREASGAQAGAWRSGCRRGRRLMARKTLRTMQGDLDEDGEYNDLTSK